MFRVDPRRNKNSTPRDLSYKSSSRDLSKEVGVISRLCSEKSHCEPVEFDATTMVVVEDKDRSTIRDASVLPTRAATRDIA